MQGLALRSGRRPGLGHSGLNNCDLVQELVHSKAEGVQQGKGTGPGPPDLRQVRLGLDHSTCFPVAPPRRLWLKRHPSLHSALAPPSARTGWECAV